MNLIKKKEFVKTPFDEYVKTFIVYITLLNLSLISIYPAKKAKISLLITKKVNILEKYSNFSNIFLEKKALVLLKITNLN